MLAKKLKKGDTIGLVSPSEEIKEEDINDINSFANDLDDRWRDMEPMPFIAVIEAVSEDDACRIAAEQYRYDHRCLFAQKI